MAIQRTFSVARAAVQPTAATSWSYSIQVDAGTNQRLVVAVCGSSSAYGWITAITYAGSAMTLVTGAGAAGGAGRTVQGWELQNAPVGTANLVITTSNNTNDGAWFGLVVDDTTASASTGNGELLFPATSTSPAITVGANDVGFIFACGETGGGAAASGTTGIGSALPIFAGASQTAMAGYRVGGVPALDSFNSHVIYAGAISIPCSAGGGGGAASPAPRRSFFLPILNH